MPNQPLYNEAKDVLLQLIYTINELSYDDYTAPIPILGNSTIGEHNRHIIELFEQLNSGYEAGIVNYDDRKRDYRLQQEIDFATEALAAIIEGLDKPDKKLTLISLYNNQTTGIESNYLREVMYNIEHCVHHQAIIKIGLIKLNVSVAEENFGVAKSTIKYRKQCVQ